MSASIGKEKELQSAELSRLFASLAMLFDSGLQLSEGFELLRNAADSRGEKRLLEAISETATEGIRLSEALTQTGGLPQYALALIQVGEQTGQISEACHALSVFYDKQNRLAASVRSSLIYPLAMMLMIFAVVVMLLTQAMPVFDQVFAQFGFEMRGLALRFLNAGTWLRSAAIGLSGAAVVFAATGFILSKMPVGRQFFSWLFEHNPVTSQLSFRLAVERLMLGLSTMLKSGMTTQTALEYSVNLVEDTRVRRRLDALAFSLGEGERFQKALDDSGLIPADSQLLVAIGFRTGLNAEAFERIGESLTLSTERQMVSLVSAIEPTLVAVMSVLVGVILLSVMLPLLGVLTSL